MTALTLAIPSKGRLKDQAEAWLQRCGFRLKQIGGERGYRAELAGLAGAEVQLLSAREIAERLLAGDLHVGITGEDLLHDLAHDLPAQARVIRPLGFGRADLVVAVPAAWIDVSTMADLDAVGAEFRQRHGRRLRVATKYLAATRRFFAARSVGDYRIVESAGATEAAPAAGTADLIVDITSTGATLAANHLKVLDDGVILKSQAALAGSVTADWPEPARATLRFLLDATEARRAADGLVAITASGPIPQALWAPLGLVDVRGALAHASLAGAAAAARALTAEGLGPVSLTPLEFVFSASNPVYDDFIAGLATVS